MDFDGMTAAEIADWITEAAGHMQQVQQEEAMADAARRASIGNAISALASLIGPEGSEPGVGSIRAVRAFDAADIAAGRERGQTMGENAGLALSLAFEALEVLASLTRDIATVTSREA